jgi:hypothetical protein
MASRKINDQPMDASINAHRSVSLDQAINARTASIIGLKVKLGVFLSFCWNETLRDDEDEDEDRLLSSIIRDFGPQAA